MNKEDKFLLDLKKYGEKNEIPNITFVNARFIRDIIRIKKAKNVLEIGTANGFSTINFAFELKSLGSGEITTIEFSPNSYDVAMSNFKKAKVEDFVNPILGNAISVIPTLKKRYDIVFIDGMKKRSKDFFVLSRGKVKKNGVVIIDDVIKFREKMQSLYDYLEEKKIDYNIIPIDGDDGIIMIIKR